MSKKFGMGWLEYDAHRVQALILVLKETMKNEARQNKKAYATGKGTDSH